MNFVVLSSSRGTTAQKVFSAIDDGSLTAQCLGLITDKESRGCVQVAKDAGIPVVIVARTKGEDRADYDKKLDEAIRALGDIDMIAALGWMFIMSPFFVEKWRNRIVNVHPALLPKHPGAHGISDALSSGDTESGMTIHFIDEGVDTGKIIEQKSCTIEPNDTEESLKKRIQELEMEWYPKVLQMIETGDITLG